MGRVMAWCPTTLSLLAFVAAGIFAVPVGRGWRRRQTGLRPFTALMAAVMLRAAIYGVQPGFTTEAELLVWQRGVLAVSGTVPPLLLFFAYQYAGKQDGYADLLAERISSSEQEELAGVISSAADDLVALSAKARQMVDIEKTTSVDGEVNVVSVLSPLLDGLCDGR